MGVEQADGLNKEKKPKLNEYNSPSEDLIMNQLYQNQSSSLETKNQTTTTSQYYYSRDETHLSNSKSEDKENVKEEPDSMTIVGNRIIKAGQPALVYEKRVICKTVKKEGNIKSNYENINSNLKVIKVIKNENKSMNNNNTPIKEENFEKESKKIEIIKNEILKKEIITDSITTVKKEIVTNNEIISDTKIITNNITSENSNTIKKEIIEANNKSDNESSNIINESNTYNINNSLKKKNIITYTAPVKIMHRSIIGNKNLRQKNILPKTNINNNKSSNYFLKNYNSNNNNNNSQMNINNKSFDKINTSSANKLLISNNYFTNKLHLKKIELSNIPISQRSHSPDINSIKRKTINRGEEVKNVQITHIICSTKNKNPNFHITEKLSTQNIKSTPLTISIQDREKLKQGGKSTYTSSCQENRPLLTQNLKGKTTIYQHARGIGMTNDKKNLNSSYYTSDIKKFEPIMTEKPKEKLEHVENFRSSKYRNSNVKRNSDGGYMGYNTIENCSKGVKKIISGNTEIKKEKIINDENNSGNIMKEIIN